MKRPHCPRKFLRRNDPDYTPDCEYCPHINNAVCETGVEYLEWLDEQEEPEDNKGMWPWQNVKGKKI